MEQQDHQLNTYRQSLIESLSEQPARRRSEEPDSLQVFVNHACVGTLDCCGDGGTFRLVHGAAPIRMVELRSATGLVVGSLYPDDGGTTNVPFSCGSVRVDVSAQNGAEGGSVHITYQPALPARERFWKTIVSTVGRGGRLGMAHPKQGAAATSLGSPAVVGYWPRTAAISQTLLSVAVLFLLADRAIGPFHDGDRQNMMQVTQTSIEEQHRVLASLTEAQREAVDTLTRQQQEIGNMTRTLTTVARTQDTMNTHLASVEHRVDDRNDRLLVSLRSTVADRDHMRNQIQQLTDAKQALTTAVVKLQQRDLQGGKTGEGSKVVASQDVKPGLAPAQSAPLQAQVAQAPSEAPFKFWVSFQDGTSEESIDHLMQEIHGRRGPTNAGWYAVEVNLPQADKADEFLQSLQGRKPVKALTTSLKAGEDPGRLKK